MLTGGKDYETIYRSFAWDIPSYYNMGVDCADKWANREPSRTALILLSKDGQTTKVSFAALARESNRAANLLVHLGVKRGQRVAILLSQGLETAVAHLAVFKLGAISVPLFSLFGEEALRFRLSDSGASILITNREGAEKVAALRQDLPALSHILSIDGGPAENWNKALESAADRFTPAQTLADDPAIIIYTSGTTGPPKGALHAQRVLLGHLPGVEMPQEFFPQPGDLFWTPADWAWIGGLFDVLLPSLHHGVPVLAHRMSKFDPDFAFDLMARQGVRNAFLPPTALKLLRAQGKGTAGLKLRSLGSGGETLGGELLEWGRDTFGVTINEFYGQTECNLVVANSSGLMPVKAGSMGRPVPGHQVAIINKDGALVPQGSVGAIAIKRPDPVMFLGYWNNEAATAKKFIGDWLVTGDEGYADQDGYLHFLGRDDDVITSAGYRIGPGEIEDCLLRHPAVRLAAAVGVPDLLRTEIVKAFIVLHAGFEASDALAKDIQAHVKTRLAAHEYPREIEFLDSLPMTATGKVMRRELRQRARR